MNATATPYSSIVETLPGDLSQYTRIHRMNPPRNLYQKVGRKLVDWAEAGLVSASVHGDKPVFDSTSFPWVPEVESEWKLIRAELDQVMTRRDEMPSFHEIIKEVGTITNDDQWKTFFLAGIGLECEDNSRRCPETMRILQKIPGMSTAFFSILSPRKHIPAHRGPYTGVLRLHLGLQVPEPKEKCRIRIANQVHHWTEGKCLIFDDTYNHEVWNDTDGYRVVLFVDFARPLKQPLQSLNKTVMNMASLAPFIREAKGKHKTWQDKFYKKK